MIARLPKVTYRYIVLLSRLGISQARFILKARITWLKNIPIFVLRKIILSEMGVFSTLEDKCL
jgi:hypothetical protein